MRGRTSLRAAAVLMAGLISASLVAPGLASAQTDQASCVSGGGTWVAASGDCVAGAGSATTGSADTGSSTGAADSGSGSTTGTTGGTTGSTPSTGNTTTLPAPGTGNATTGDATATTGDPADAGSTPGTATPGAATATRTVDSTAPSPTNEKAAQTGAASIKAAVADITEEGGLAALPTDLPVPVVLPDLGFDIPTSIPDGGFTNPQQACAYFGSLVTVPVGDPTGLGSQIGTFCGALPTSFTDGLGSVTGLVDQLTALLKKLAASLPKPPSNIPGTPPQGTPDHFKGWWNKHHDIDCGDVSHDEAQAILRLDRHDPFNLDGDDDGEACERNSKYVECWDGDDHEVVETVEYEGYPVGGVSTGDSDPATDAAPVAASALGLVMTAGLASVAGARHRRDDDADERDDADDRDVPQAA